MSGARGTGSDVEMPPGPLQNGDVVLYALAFASMVSRRGDVKNLLHDGRTSIQMKWLLRLFISGFETKTQLCSFSSFSQTTVLRK